MVRRNTPQHYDTTARIFHWVTALLIVAQMSTGFYMTRLDFSTWKMRVYGWHGSIGIALAALVVTWLIWRMRNRPPPFPPSAWVEQIAARASHAALFALLVLLPVFGFLGATGRGLPIHLMGGAEVRPPVELSDATGEALLSVHSALAWTLTIVAAVHVLAALYHHFARRDGILQRMIPSLRPRRDD